MIRQSFAPRQIRRFAADERGLVLTEYLLLLGLIAGGVSFSVLTFGETMSETWSSWTNWVTRSLPVPAAKP